MSIRALLCRSISTRWPSAQTGLLTASGLLLAILATVVALMLRNEYHDEVVETFAAADRTAQKLAIRTAEVFDRVNQTTLLVKYLTEREQAPSLFDLRLGGVLANDVTRIVLMTDARGVVVDSTSELVAMSLGDDDDFKAHKRRTDLDVTIGVPAPNVLAGGYVIPVSRRLNHPDGSFAGILSATIDPVVLSGDYARSEARDTAIGIVGLDGVYRSRFVGGKLSFGERIEVDSLERRAREMRDLRLPTRSPVDGVDRFLAAVRVERYPFVAIAAVNADTALAGYRHTRASILVCAAVIAATILFGTLALRVKVHALEVSRRQTKRAEAAIRATIEGSLDAVSIMLAKRDGAGTLVDLEVRDCNERAAALIGLTRADVIGRTLNALSPTIGHEGYFARFDMAIRSGKTSSAEVLATDPHLAGRWLHHQVVPIEDGIALITRDVTEKKEREQAMAAMAHVDALTQLGNRRDFEKRLKESQSRCQREGLSLALLFIDLDGFKLVNDRHGHAAGDALLIEVARRIKDCVRFTDAVNRLGGDEFTVTLETKGQAQQITDLSERIVASLSRPHALAGASVVSTPSIGIAVLQPGESLESLQSRADAAMYEAKRAGKARYRFAPSQPPVSVAS